MTTVSYQQLSRAMQSHARQLVDQVGLVPQAEDRPLEAVDLIFYLSETSMPMVDLLRRYGLFVDNDGLHFDVAQFGAIRTIAETVVAEHQAGRLDGIWKKLDLSGDEDADNDGGYLLTAIAALELLYAS